MRTALNLHQCELPRASTGWFSTDKTSVILDTKLAKQSEGDSVFAPTFPPQSTRLPHGARRLNPRNLFSNDGLAGEWVEAIVPTKHTREAHSFKGVQIAMAALPKRQNRMHQGMGLNVRALGNLELSVRVATHTTPPHNAETCEMHCPLVSPHMRFEAGRSTV
jgi:hypothetical protein